MSTPPKVEITSREAIIAIGFVLLVIVAVALVQSGVITNPVTLGLIITLTIALIFVGHFLARIGVISRQATPLWYILTFGIVMLVYGGIMMGVVPAAFSLGGVSVLEVALTNALFYTLVVAAIFAALAAVYVYSKHRKKMAVATF